MTEAVSDTLLDESRQSVTAVQSFVGSLTVQRIAMFCGLLLVCVLAVRLLLAAERRLLKKTTVGEHLHNAILSVTRLILIFFAIMLLAGTLGIDTSSILTVLGVLALAISLSVQDTLSDVTAALTLLCSKPFRVGDYIEIEGVYGRVDLIGLIYTRILTIEGHFLYVPNRKAASGIICNHTEEGGCCVEIRVAAGYEFPAAQVREALLDAADVPHLLPDRPLEVFLSGYNANDISYLLRLWTTQEFYRETYFSVLERVQSSFAAHGVSMSYPHVVVHEGRN